VGQGLPITVPVGSMDGCSYHSTCGLDWMGAPITVCVGQIGSGAPIAVQIMLLFIL
jgi:hypothetical protein